MGVSSRYMGKHTIPERAINTRIASLKAPKEENELISTTSQIQEPSGIEWVVSFGAMMTPFLGFCYFHQLSLFSKTLNVISKSRFGVYGFLALPFATLSMEKCIYDTVQSLQGINPNVVPEGRGGFPSGGAALPSFSLVDVRKRF